MIPLAIALLAAQAAPAPATEEQARKALAARGLSAPGIEATLAIQRRHTAPMGAIVQRGQAAEAALRAALAKRPVDVNGFVAAMTARSEAAAALQREAGGMAIEQMRAVSPADRIVLAQAAQPGAAQAATAQPPRR